MAVSIDNRPRKAIPEAVDMASRRYITPDARARGADPVNHPEHYTAGAIECIDAIESALGPVGFAAYLRGQVMKYTWRTGLKGDALQDAQKAAWYQARLIAVLGHD